jgi:outer membrane protein TolC
VNKSILSVVILSLSSPALALQPLDEFVRGARDHHPANREARANEAGAEAQADEALGRALPGLLASGTYSRNEWEVSVGGLALVPRDQLDGNVTLAVPLIDLAKFARISAARRSAEAAGHRQRAVARASEGQVVQLYYQLAADLALTEAARKTLEAVRVNLKVAEESARAGTATSLDVQRASAEVERQTQLLTAAELEAKLAARALASRTGIEPETVAGPALGDDLHPEPPLASFLAHGPRTPAALAAGSARSAAERAATAQRLSLLPALAGSLGERYTNATGFLGGHHHAYVAALTASWALDFSSLPGIRARSAEADAARAREDQAGLEVGDAIFRAWSTIEASIARSRSARAQASVSARAADIARSRYRSGLATQLDLIQAERDAFSAEASRIQSDADLLNARLQLRLLAAE